MLGARFMTAVYALTFGLVLIVGLLGMLVVGLLRTQAEIIRRLNSLGIQLDEDESAAPISLSTKPDRLLAPSEIVGVSPNGEPVVKSLELGSSPVLLAFLSTTCTSCSEFWAAFDSAEISIHSARYRTILVTLGPDEESPTRAISLTNGDADVVMSSEAWSRFEVPGAPYFALIDPAERTVIGEGTAGDMRALTTFLSDSAGDRRWDAAMSVDRTDADRERLVDDELKRAGLLPGDPRLYHEDHGPGQN